MMDRITLPSLAREGNVSMEANEMISNSSLLLNSSTSLNSSSLFFHGSLSDLSTFPPTFPNISKEELKEALHIVLSDSLPFSSTLNMSTLFINKTTTLSVSVQLNNFTRAEKVEAVDTLLNQGYVFTASPYEPGGWREIFAVMLCSMFIFFLPSLLAWISLWRNPPQFTPSPRLRPSKSSFLLPGLNSLRKLLEILHRFLFPNQRIARDVDVMGCEGAAYLLLVRECGRFLLFLGVTVNTVLVPIYLSFPSLGGEKDRSYTFSQFTFQNVPHSHSHVTLWIHILLVYLIALASLRFSMHLHVSLWDIEAYFHSENGVNPNEAFVLKGQLPPPILPRLQKEFPFILKSRLLHSVLPDQFQVLIICKREDNMIQYASDSLQVLPGPEPQDILWDTYGVSRWKLFTRSFLVNFSLVVLLSLFTTPVAFITFLSAMTSETMMSEMQTSYMHFVSLIRTFNPWFGDFLFSFLPQVLLVVFDAWLLAFLSLCSKEFEFFYTSSKRETALLVKSYWFLLFNTLLLPSLALSSVGSFVSRLRETSVLALLGKAFETSSGAFTLTFIATQTWVGAAMDIAKVSERIIRLIVGKQLGEFDFGSEYAMALTMFSLCIVFATVVPPILWFGVLYFFVKQATDEYLLRYIVPLPKDKQLVKAYSGKSAIRLLVVSVLLLQLALLGFFSAYICVPEEEGIEDGGGGPCVDKHFVGVLATRGTRLQRFSLVLCFLFTLGGLWRTWNLGDFGSVKKGIRKEVDGKKEEMWSLRAHNNEIPQDAFDVI